MGCDIHMFVEYRVDGGKWLVHPGHKIEIEEEDTIHQYIHYSEVSATSRNYELFGALAGVRCDGPDAKGRPHDCSEFVAGAIKSWDDDGHSHSYLSLDEFESILNSFDYYPPTDRADMFYDYKNGYDKRPPDYTTIVTACRKHAMELAVDGILLDTEKVTEIEHRVVVFFDN